MADETPDFPSDSTASTNKIVRQIDCQYTFGKERMTIILKFKGIANDVTTWTAKFREGYRVNLADIRAFSEATAIPTTNLEETGKVLQSTCSTTTGAANATITLAFPYSAKSSWNLGEPAEDSAIVTWEEKSTDYEFGLEVYAGEDDPNAGDFEAWKNEKNKNIENYKEFKYTPEGGGDAVELKNKTLDLAKKYYAGIESVRRAYPEVIRTTRYLNYKSGDKDEVDATLLGKINETPNLYYKDPTPADVWDPIFPKDNFDWLKASFDVQTEPTEYDKVWNMTVTESWLGIDKTDRGEWDDDLYGDNRWPFALAEKNANVDGNPAPGDGRVNDTTFNNQKDIKKINLNNAYTAVDANAFKATPTRGLRSASTGIPDLEEIKMPAVSFIGDDAFNGAANLKSINLTNYITYMGERVFQGCTSMTEAIIKPWIYDLPASTFEGCTSLDAPSGSPLKVGGLVKTIGASAFKDCTSLTSVACENAITSVGDNAFDGDVKLSYFAVPTDSTGTITLGDEAFKGCEKLADIELPVPTITVGTDTFDGAFDDEVTVKAPKSFLSNLPNTSSYTYIYPAFVDTMASAEWQNDTKLLGAVVCDAITSIPENAFRGCTNCTSVTLPDTVTSLGHDAFRQSGITSFVTPPLITGTLVYNMFYQCTALESVDFGNATILGADIFAGCTALTELFNEDKLTSIQARAFSDCAFVEFNGGSGLAGLGQSCFRRNAALKSFKIPENETRSLNIGATAFDSCTALERIEIPVGGTLTIGTTIFNNGLASEIWLKAPFNSTLIASIPSSKRINFIYPSFTTSIASAEWQNSVKIKSAAIPGGVTSVGANAFDGCTNLTEITMADKDISTVQGMTNYPFGLTTGQVIHCSDGDITIS